MISENFTTLKIKLMFSFLILLYFSKKIKKGENNLHYT